MAPARLHKYNLVGENNPYWMLAEPVLLKVWADAILRTRATNLHLANLMSFLISVMFWAGGTILRLTVVAGVLGLGFVLFPASVYTSIHSVLYPSPVDIWVYRLVGYIIVIEATVIVFAGFPAFLLDCALYSAFAATNMVPLRLVAKNLQKGSAVAQAVAKTSFMGTYIVQTMTATPQRDQHKWDAVMNLYLNSNTSWAREKLESLAAEHNSSTDGL
jgi:hypothetical protein